MEFDGELDEMTDLDLEDAVVLPRLRALDASFDDTITRIMPVEDGRTSSSSVLYGADVEPRRRDSRRRHLFAASDLVALALTFLAVAVLSPPPAIGANVWLPVAAIPLWIVLNKVLGLYDRDANVIHKSTLDELPRLAHSVSLGTALLYMFGPTLTGIELGRTQAITFWAAGCAFMPLLRLGARHVARRTSRPERVLIVGSGHVAGLVARKIGAHPEYGATVVGYVDVPLDADEVAPETVRLGGIHDFEAVCREYHVERVVVAFSSLAHESLLDVIRVSKRLRLKISVVPRLFEVIGHSVEIDQIEGLTLLGLRGLTRTKSTLQLKRAVDVGGALVLLVFAAPLMAVAALLVKTTSAGPVFFVQQRVGRGNRVFRMFKFRTMVVGAESMKADLLHLNEMDGRMFKITTDPRVTRVGRFLRRASIDELPQLLNVLRGEMSLVGPRPLVPDENAHIIGWHRARLDLTPGLTGPWQVMGRNAIPFDEMVKLDYLYVAEWSLWNDLKLIFRTLPVVVGRRGS